MTTTVRLLAFTLGLMATAPAVCAAGTTVKVTLWDRGANSVMMDDAHMKLMGRMMGGNMMMSGMMMGITLDRAKVPGGTVTFDVTNDSKVMIHEMILSPVKPGQAELPYRTEENRVDEDAAGHLGEVSELDAGKGGSLTVELKPGTYILYCNIPGHFISGMWTVLTVGG